MRFKIIQKKQQTKFEMMQERFLHFIWKLRLFNPTLLSLSDEVIEVLNPGEHNQNAGPDFLNAKIRIGTTIWVGNVEIHVKMSDWLKHAHQNDVNYRNLILHLVYINDIKSRDEIPDFPATVELKGQFDEKPWMVYQNLINSRNWIPCEKTVDCVDARTWIGFSERLVIEKIEQKFLQISQTVNEKRIGWDWGFTYFMFRNFGFHINNTAFEILAATINHTIIAKHRDNQFQIEALLFGLAGLLEKNFIDDYPCRLQKEFLHLKVKYSLSPIKPSLWRFLRLHPQNFPTLRLAQLASVLTKNEHIFSKVIENPAHEQYYNIFQTTVNDYWKNHYQFDKITSVHNAELGINSINLLIINTITPFLYSYGRFANMESLTGKAISLLENIPPENNSIISNWNKLNIKCENALDSQALIYLYGHYCKLKKCLDCRIGLEILKTN